MFIAGVIGLYTNFDVYIGGYINWKTFIYAVGK